VSITPIHGSINIEGKLVPFIELGVGFNPELSGRDNVFLNGALLGFNRREIAAMYDEIVEFAELENLWIKNSKTTLLVCKFAWPSR
jgi:ABC-2 type transport system ATP-binding protein